jgi:hypothetical protein
MREYDHTIRRKITNGHDDAGVKRNIFKVLVPSPGYHVKGTTEDYGPTTWHQK